MSHKWLEHDLALDIPHTKAKQTQLNSPLAWSQAHSDGVVLFNFVCGYAECVYSLFKKTSRIKHGHDSHYFDGLVGWLLVCCWWYTPTKIYIYMSKALLDMKMSKMMIKTTLCPHENFTTSNFFPGMFWLIIIIVVCRNTIEWNFRLRDYCAWGVPSSVLSWV